MLGHLNELVAATDLPINADFESGYASSAGEVGANVKLAVETQSGNQVVEREGRVQSGKKLKYAVKMNPDCMAPPTGRFRRVLPEGVLGRMTNYVLFHVVEALWPNGDDHIKEADLQSGHAVALAASN